MSQPPLPQYVLDKVEELSRRSGMSKQALIEMYSSIYSDPFVQTDPQFRTDDERHRYCLEVLHVKVFSQPPTSEFYVIPFGFAGPTMTKQGLMARIYAVVREKGSAADELGVILLRGQHVELLDQVRCLYAYKVRLAKFKAKGIYFATSATKFDSPASIPVDPLTFLKKHVNAREVKIAETPYNLSRKVDKYTDEFDLRIVTGIVLRYNYGKRPSGTDWAVYTIADDSVGSEIVTKEGYVVPSQFTVWVPIQFLKYDVDSKLMFLGTIQLSEDREPFMNAIFVYPIYARPLAEVVR